MQGPLLQGLPGVWHFIWSKIVWFSLGPLNVGYDVFTLLQTARNCRPFKFWHGMRTLLTGGKKCNYIIVVTWRDEELDMGRRKKPYQQPGSRAELRDRTSGLSRSLGSQSARSRLQRRTMADHGHDWACGRVRGAHLAGARPGHRGGSWPDHQRPQGDLTRKESL